MWSEANLRWHRLDDVTVRLTVTQSDGSGYDLTGGKIKVLIKDAKSDVDGAARITKVITGTVDPDQGQILNQVTDKGKADVFFNNDDTDATFGLEEDKVIFFGGAKLLTSASKLHTLWDGTLRLIREVMGTFA